MAGRQKGGGGIMEVGGGRGVGGRTKMAQKSIEPGEKQSKDKSTETR